MILIDRCKWNDIESAAGLDRLVQECRKEGGAEGLPEGKLSHEMYKKLEANGVLFIVRARDDDKLLGCINILIYVSPHYSLKLAQIDLVYLDKEYRETSAGLRMIKEAEAIAQEQGAYGISFNAHVHTSLEDLLNLKKYTLTHKIYFKAFHEQLSLSA